MKSSIWFLALLGITYGIGWQSSRFFDRDDAPPATESRGSSGFRFDSPGRFGGPIFGSTRDFAEEIGLDTTQREKLATIVESSEAEIDHHGDAMYDVKERARQEVLALLTDDQRGRLQRKFDESLERHAKESVANDMSWLSANASLPAETLTRVETILTEYETAKRGLLRPDCGPGEPRATESEWRVLREKRDAQLAATLEPTTLERFRSERSRGRGRGGRPGPDNHESHDRPKTPENKP